MLDLNGLVACPTTRDSIIRSKEYEDASDVGERSDIGSKVQEVTHLHVVEPPRDERIQGLRMQDSTSDGSRHFVTTLILQQFGTAIGGRESSQL